ncbi:protein kinase domain-containing protein [Flexivirga oryzae]|uniref:non-specific serine/threonine protein kinase n=1 Tax=Flexivirga oryzae TaxID=1794944 RepID=A0A839N8E3_9MICO|nr:serine/threonine-protein kinase [Flexivirga oryzae]
MSRGLHEGDIFAGYRIRGLLGRGGMGAVYAADHPRLPRTVAIKTLTAATDDREALARFEREAEMIARLDHPGIVSVLDRGVEDGVPWISMQFVRGSDVAALLRAHGPMPLDRAATIAAQTADALDYAHARGVLHRDVKPANIMLESEAPGRALLTDFGIATVLDHSHDITSTGQTLATFDFASPEQLRGGQLDGRSDQYSLACTVHTLLTGRAPYASDNVATVVQGHLTAPPPALSATRPDLGADVSSAIVRALSKDPADRFASCREFAEALRGTGPAVATPVQQAAAPAAARRRRPALVWGAGAGAVLVLAAGGYGLSRSLSDAAPPPTTTTDPTSSTSSTSQSGMPTGDDGPGQLAVWDAVKPAQQLWPTLLPQTPTGVGYTGLKCAAVTKKVTGTMPQYNYRLNCARADGLELEMLAYDTSSHVDRLVSYYGAKGPINLTAANGRKLIAYKLVDPDNAKTWMLVQVQGDSDKGAYAFQVSGLEWQGEATFVATAPW